MIVFILVKDANMIGRSKIAIILTNNKALGGSNPSFCLMNFI